MWWFETEHCKIRFLDDVHAVNIKWLGFPRSDEFREACNKALELMSEKQASKFLTDNSDAVVFATSDQKWLNEEWLPRAKIKGYRASAVILSAKEGFTRLAVNNIISGRGKEFTAKNFTNYEDAKKWLLEI